MGRAVVVGCAVGVVIAFAVTTVGVLAADQEWGSAVGLGLFVALWGGLGFGSMVGGVIFLSRLEAAEVAHVAAANREAAPDRSQSSAAPAEATDGSGRALAAAS